MYVIQSSHWNEFVTNYPALSVGTYERLLSRQRPYLLRKGKNCQLLFIRAHTHIILFTTFISSSSIIQTRQNGAIDLNSQIFNCKFAFINGEYYSDKIYSVLDTMLLKHLELNGKCKEALDYFLINKIYAMHYFKY